MTREAPITFDRKQFGSDNYSGICPEAWSAMAEANARHEPAYGTDQWTRRASDLIRDFFECDCEVFFVFNGTAANSLALSTLCRSYHSIICHNTAHVETDECGAPEFFSNGTKVLLVSGDKGRMSILQIEETILRRNDIHYPKPHVLSLTQATELGTIYQPDQIQASCDLARKYGLHVHMDGARFANALATLDCHPKDITWGAGVDVLCFGGTKNGIGIGEAVVFFNKELAYEFEYRCKQAGQLCSKMRFLAAPWVGMLESGALMRNAKHANRCARHIEEGLKENTSARILYPVEANSVFLELPNGIFDEVCAKGWHFYNFIANCGARLMCSWDTEESDIDQLVDDIAQCLPKNQNVSVK